MNEKIKQVRCPVCTIEVNAEIISKELTGTHYRCEHTDKDGNPHSFMIYNRRGHFGDGAKFWGGFAASILGFVGIFFGPKN